MMPSPPPSPPGLPTYHPDLLIGVLVRNKSRDGRHMPIKSPPQKLRTSVTLRTCHKRVHSSSTDPEAGASRSKVKRHRRHRDLQVGIGDRTPPHASDEGGMDLDPTDGDGSGDEIGGPVLTDMAASELARDSASPGEEEMELDESEGAPSEPTAVPVSFYGEHKPLSDSQPPSNPPLDVCRDWCRRSSAAIAGHLHHDRR